MITDYYDYPFGKFKRPFEKCEFINNDLNIMFTTEAPETGTLDNVRM